MNGLPTEHTWIKYALLRSNRIWKRRLLQILGGALKQVIEKHFENITLTHKQRDV